MGVYIGYIEIKGDEPIIFLNFKPIAELRESKVFLLSASEQEELLPESEKRNINFSFSWNDREERRQIDAMFSEKSLAVFEFTVSDLLPNIKTTGERNQTGYKVQVIEMIESGKIRSIDSEGIYHIVRKGDLLSDFTNDTVVEIDVPGILSGNKVFVELDEFWAGPYEVGFREYTSSFYIKPQIKENKYTIKGYNQRDVVLQELNVSNGYWGAPENKWTILVPNSSAVSMKIDVISEEVLIESFRESLQNSVVSGGKINLEDIPTLLKHYEESALVGSSVTDEVRRNRLNRLVDILTAETDVNDTLNIVADFICDLLIKYQDSSNVEQWVQVLLEKHPELIEQLKGTQAISKRIAQVEQSLTDLQQERADLEDEIDKKKAEVNEIDRAAIEAKKIELLQMDAEYKDLCTKLESVKKFLGAAESILDLQKKQDEYQKEVDYLENHKKHLNSDTKDLEVAFQQLVSNPHEKMVSIAFDGFMASKMLHAAAQWEAEEAIQQQEDMINRINNVPTTEKSPEELVEYLCRTIQLVRPTYSKNTIVNIAICLTQGFLTVFSGEPGCGKTSICNIFGEVLGLNKITEYVECGEKSIDSVRRYVPVSVERGWTSKRDFVGYYNPLSKTFDKSNRRVYDALYQLDKEKNEKICKLPYVILLDEANLSPMEYYWSDFMNICDDLGPQSNVNLGENYILNVPETLHFFATINNDHTTETLSPRLIDRAWIISLPQQYNTMIAEEEIPAEQIDIVTWQSLREAFIPEKEECVLSAEIQRIYDAVIMKLREKRISISPRIDRAIKRYWTIAAKRFEMDETRTDAETVALDYAVAQRILPKIAGNGENFENWLNEFRSLCSSDGLNMSAKILQDIVERGNQQMKYYQFFC